MNNDQEYFHEMCLIFDFNRTIYDPDTGGLIDGALQMLEENKNLPMVLICKNENGRSDLIDSLDIRRFFEKIVITDKKTKEDFEDVKSDFPARRYIAIGDRLKEEIKYANEAGIETVWFCFGKFASETPELTGVTPTRIIYSLRDF